MALVQVDFERQIEKRFVEGLRAIFEVDDTFIYNDNDVSTKVMITPEYPEKDSTLKTPHIIVTNISFNFNLQNSFSGNYHKDIIGKGPMGQDEVIGKAYANNVPYSLNIMCLGEYFISKDIANKVSNYISFDASEIFDYLKLNVQNVGKSPTVAQQQYSEHIFETVVSVQGYLHWAGRKIPNPHLLQRIKQTIDMKMSL